MLFFSVLVVRASLALPEAIDVLYCVFCTQIV